MLNEVYVRIIKPSFYIIELIFWQQPSLENTKEKKLIWIKYIQNKLN